MPHDRLAAVTRTADARFVASSAPPLDPPGIEVGVAEIFAGGERLAGLGPKLDTVDFDGCQRRPRS
jgi:hypothetical protein